MKSLNSVKKQNVKGMSSWLLLADGSNAMFRRFTLYARYNKGRLHTNAVYGLATTLSRHIESIKPDSVAVALTSPRRHSGMSVTPNIKARGVDAC